jgi:putative ABC transport system permease protein
MGTMSIIIVLSLMNGIQQKTLEWMMERGGLSKITVNQDWSYESPTNQPKFFTLREIELIRNLVPDALYMNPMITSRGRFSFQKKTFWNMMSGVLPDYSPVEEWDVQEGRFISELDVREASDVIVIGTTIKDELFGNQNPVGNWITAHNRRYLVIGVMQHRFLENQGAFGDENMLEYMNRRAFIPLSTMIYKGTGENRITSFAVKARDPLAAIELKEKIESILLNLRYGEPVFYVESAQEEAQKMKESQFIMTVIFFLISAISLLVGGIVIMNIMLASIRERTREIGIRLAVGARKNDVFIQFLVQTIMITTLGGLIGVISGISILDFVGDYLKISLIPNLTTIIVALSVSAGVGFFAGIIPAIFASHLNPVEALRYE